MTSRLSAKEIGVTFPRKTALKELSIEIEQSKLTMIIGPNGSGKSTLLRSLGRLQPLNTGKVTLDGKDIKRHKTRLVARELAVLPQGLTPPEGITVQDLVGRGRLPHQSPLQNWSAQDSLIVQKALERTGLSDLSSARVTNLSGGQQQRVWIAMILAQDTDILLLDEPTTFLDLSHQIELLRLVRSLCVESGHTVVVVLHDINLAARFADRIVALKNGRIEADGAPADVITAETIARVFELDCRVITDPVHSSPIVIPA